MIIRHVILDRDGVLNTHHIIDPAKWVWIPGSLDALVLLTRSNVRVSVATNQGAIGRGSMTTNDLNLIHDKMLRDCIQVGAKISRVYVCPHIDADECECRKPRPGMILQAITESGIDPSETLVVGDNVVDLTAAHNARVAAALVLTGTVTPYAARAAYGTRVPVYDDLKMLVHALILHETFILQGW